MCEQNENCNHPAIAECASCGIGLCSAHIVECSDCRQVFCSECATGHTKKGMHRVTIEELQRFVQRCA